MKSKANYMPPEIMYQAVQAIPSLHIRKWNDYDIQMMMKCCYWIDLRIMEIIPRNAEDFDLIDGELYLGKTKNDKEAYAIIPPDFRPELIEWLKRKTGPLFPGLSYHNVYGWLKKLGEQLDIKAWTIPQSVSGEKTVTHIFRKSMSKDLLYGLHGERTPINVISKHLRHKGRNPIASTYQYLKLDTEDVKDWFNQQNLKEQTNQE